MTDQATGPASIAPGAENLRASLRRGQGADGSQGPARQGPANVVPSLPPRASFHRRHLVLFGQDGWIAGPPSFPYGCCGNTRGVEAAKTAFEAEAELHQLYAYLFGFWRMVTSAMERIATLPY